MHRWSQAGVVAILLFLLAVTGRTGAGAGAAAGDDGPPYTLTISPVPAGGRVQGAGIDCGAGGAACSVTMPAAMTIGLSATAEAGYTFGRWTGDCAGTSPGLWLALKGARTCGAAFTPAGGGEAPPAPVDGPPYTLTISPVPAGGRIQGAGISCGAGGAACSVTMPAPMTIGLSASAEAGYTFSGWTGDCAGTSPGLWLALKGARACGAAFTPAGGSVTPPAGGTITTYAGTGTPGYGGDDGPATAARVYLPMEIAADAAGNLYIADYGNHRIRKVAAATGIISTAAGTGGAGFSGDGGPAAEAQLDNPTGVAADAAGNLFIVDRENQRLRRVDAATGIITTVAGTGVAESTGDGGPAAAAGLHNPYAVAVDAAGSLFITEHGSNRVRRIDAATGIITAFAGTGAAGYSGDGGPATEATLQAPYGVEADPSGSVYVADLYNHCVRRVDAATGTITTAAGTGAAGLGADGVPATESALDCPIGLAFDAAGNLLVAEYANHRVRAVNPATGLVTTVAGNGTQGFSGDGGPATDAQLSWPYGVAVDRPGNMFVADFGNARIRRVSAGTVAPAEGPPYTLTISPVPAGGRVQGAGIRCGEGGTACSVTMPAAMTMGLEAVASAGYAFSSWTGDCAGARAGLWLPLTGPRACGATFRPR